MQYLPAFCLALAALIVTSCTSDSEDRRFFGTGWLKPEEGANRRLEQPQSLVPVKNDYDRLPTSVPAVPPPPTN